MIFNITVRNFMPGWSDTGLWFDINAIDIRSLSVWQIFGIRMGVVVCPIIPFCPWDSGYLLWGALMTASGQWLYILYARLLAEELNMSMLWSIHLSLPRLAILIFYSLRNYV